MSFLGKAFLRLSAEDHDFREKCFITSKGGVEGIFADGVHINNSHEYLKKACAESLQRLGIEYLDLYYLHRHDGKTSPEAIVDTLMELLRDGKIRSIGLSEVDPLFIAKAHLHAQTKYGMGIAAIQPEYSIGSREIEYSGILKLCKKLDITVIPYGAISRGILTNRVTSTYEPQGFVTLLPRFNREALEKIESKRLLLDQFAQKLNCTVSQLSLSWLLHQKGNIIPIPGTRKIAHLLENIQAPNVHLTDLHLKFIDNNFPLDTFSPRYPLGFTETELDKKWIKSFQAIQEKSRIKIQMSEIHNVVFRTILAHRQFQLTHDHLSEIIKLSVNNPLIKALHAGHLAELVDGILSSSIAIYDGQSSQILPAVCGQRELFSDSKPIEFETLFNVASISNFIIMVMITRLCLAGKLDLSKTITDYLPMIPAIPEASLIRLSDLLLQQSGLKSKNVRTYTKEQPLEDLLEEERAGQPGEQFYYSIINYVLLGLIIESVTQDTLGHQFIALVAEPLGLRHSYAVESDAQDENLALGFHYTNNISLFKKESAETIWSASGFRSTPSDLVKLMHHYFNDENFIPIDMLNTTLNSCREVEFKVVIKKSTHKWSSIYGFGIEKHFIPDPTNQSSLTIYANGGMRDGSALFLAYVPDQKLSVCYACTKIQGAHKLDLSKLTSGFFFKKPKEKMDEFVYNSCSNTNSGAK